MDGPLGFEPVREENPKTKKAKQTKPSKLPLDKSSDVAEWLKARLFPYLPGFGNYVVVFTLFMGADFIAQSRGNIWQKKP